MKFISYSQNFEDVILNRIFRHKKDGFYVDVGACHPTYDSVTKHFYDRGWTGINIEPVPEMAQLFREDRPKDINLAVAIGNTSGEIELYVTPSRANSTCCIEVLETYPDEGIVIEDKTNKEKHTSSEYQSNEIFKASDMMVDALTKLLDKERNKRKANQ